MNVSKSRKRKANCLKVARVGAVLAASLALFVAPAARADEAFDLGVKSFSGKDYSTAAKYFKKSVENNSLNANAVYYLALSQHYMGDFANAKATYEALLSKFPGTPAANNARTALAQLTATMPKSAGSASSSGRPSPAAAPDDLRGTSSDFASLPDECRVHFEIADSGHIFVPGAINNRFVPNMLFDTGAEVTVLAKNILRDCGMPMPSGEPKVIGIGVGNKPKRSWVGKCTVKIGTIERKDLPVEIQEDPLRYPIIGQSFFKDYHYTIDNGGQSIQFQKKGKVGGSSHYDPAHDPYAVPFKKEGNELLVLVEINGRPIWMYFDTGASGVAIPKTALSQLSLSVPPDARQSMHHGVSGEVRGVDFAVQRIKLGPIEKTNFNVSVIDQALPHPLLGQTFFGDWQYQIDADHRVIRFTRR